MANYDRRAFAEAYLLAQAEPGDPQGGFQAEHAAYNDALTAHRKRVLAGLEQLFELTLDRESIRSAPGGPALFMLFNSTVRSCLALTGPFGGFLEAGLLVRKLEETGAAGARVLEVSGQINELTGESRAAHLTILDELLGVFLGDRADRMVTSADLAAVGVDDAGPRSSDYPWDD